LPAQPLTPEMLKVLELLMDTGLAAGGLLGPGPPSPAGGQLPLGLPPSPERHILGDFDDTWDHKTDLAHSSFGKCYADRGAGKNLLALEPIKD
jgi:hypothetical protein